MRVEQVRLEASELVSGFRPVSKNPDLVLIFAAPEIISLPGFFETLKSSYPSSLLTGCSTAGGIYHTEVLENTVVICEITFTSSRCSVITEQVAGNRDSFDAGRKLAEKVDMSGLRAVILLAPGVDINGSAIVDGMVSVLGDIPISGGLAGDEGAFQQTFTLTPEGVDETSLVAICLYGENLSIEYSSFGGWQPFGPLRKVTRHQGNTLQELDGRPALELYKRYLGEYASELPKSGLYFPLEMVHPDNRENGLIRTIMSVDDQTGDLILAGDIDPECYMRLMHASTDGLINGADVAASRISPSDHDRLALLVSCVGRKIIMCDEVCEEIEAVKMRLGPSTATTGFYSFGEICPSLDARQCQFHNQTMTLTVISESV